MSSVKSNPEGLKVVECEHGVGSKNAPIWYIPEQDPVQDVLEKTKKTIYCKLTLPNTGNKLKGAINLGIRDSGAVPTSCPYCFARLQAAWS